MYENCEWVHESLEIKLRNEMKNFICKEQIQIEK